MNRSSPRWRLGPTITAALGDRSQADLARELGTSRERVSQIVTGRVRWPDADTFNDLAHALNMPVVTLLRAAGADIPEARDERIDWLVSQLDDAGLALLDTLARKQR